MNVEAVEEAYDHCVRHDRWPNGFNPFDAIRDLLAEVRGYRRSMVGHHNLATLSEEVLADWDGRECPVCRESQKWDAT